MTNRLLHYRGAISALPELISEYQALRVLLVTGQSSYNHFPQKEIIEKGLQHLEVRRHAGFAVNPKIEDLEAAIEKWQDFRPDVIVGIGGGSVMDTAKLIAAFLTMDTDVRQFIADKKKVQQRVTPLILIPTTAGTGSEATHFAVVYLGAEKYSVASPCLLPDKVILDADFTDNAPAYLTACTAFDALGQAIESFWAKGATEESKGYALESIRMMMELYNKLVTHPDALTREQMLYASYLSGKAINISKTTAPHALSYSLTTNYGLPHGHAVAMTLGQFLVFNLSGQPEETIPDRHLLLEALGCLQPSEAKDKLAHMMQLAGMQTTLPLKKGEDRATATAKLLSHVNTERLGNNPVPVAETDVRAVYEALFEKQQS